MKAYFITVYVSLWHVMIVCSVYFLSSILWKKNIVTYSNIAESSVC